MKTIENATKTSTITGAEAVVRSLMEEGVETLFGYPGGAIMPVYDALYDYQDELKHILTRHEQGAVHAAQGYSRVSGKVGVCLATSGPGATNLITGIADAQIDSTPIVCITGQVASHLLGTDAFQETDVIGISMPVTKWSIQVTSAVEIPKALAKAFFIAKSGRPGPVLVDITKNAQMESFKYSYSLCTGIRSYHPESEVKQTSLQEAADLIEFAKRPFIVFGNGVILGKAQDQFKTFVEKSGIPCASTIMGLSALETDHPLHMGMLGMHGNYAPNVLTNKCDVLIAVGMRFDDRVTGDLSRYAKQAKVIHLDIDPAEIGKNVPVDVAVLGDCKKSLHGLTQLVKKKTYPSWLNRFSECKEKEWEKVIGPEIMPDTASKIKMAEVIHQLSVLTKGKATIVTDVGQHQMIAQRYYNFSRWRSNVTSGGLGTMGFALPAAIGAKLAQPKNLVVAVIGDGGFQMTVQELGTVLQTGVALKILILNNEFLGMVRQWQDLFFDKRYSSTEMMNPDFQMIAKGYGIKAEKVTERKALGPSLTRFIHEEGAFLLEVMVSKEDNVFPMVPTGSSVSDIKLEP